MSIAVKPTARLGVTEVILSASGTQHCARARTFHGRRSPDTDRLISIKTCRDYANNDSNGAPVSVRDIRNMHPALPPARCAGPLSRSPQYQFLSQYLAVRCVELAAQRWPSKTVHSRRCGRPARDITCEWFQDRNDCSLVGLAIPCAWGQVVFVLRQLFPFGYAHYETDECR
jgi:hypothetical protein